MIHSFGTADEKLNVNAGIAALGHPIRTATQVPSLHGSST
jgi:acetyl-CoA acetyltransferase